MLSCFLADQADSSPATPLSVALVTRYRAVPAHLSGIGARRVQEPHEIRSSDDVVLFYGTGMARTLQRFSAETAGELPPAVVLAHWLDLDDVYLALDQGAAGYLLEHRCTRLSSEVLPYTSGGRNNLVSSLTAERVGTAARVRQPKRARTAAAVSDRLLLSRQEQQVMELLVAGLSVPDVAREMCLADKTVRNYLSQIYQKLNVPGKTQAILCWLGYLEPRAQ